METTSPAQTYKYRPVSREHLETHLITLYPGHYDDDVRIHLSIARLSVPDGQVVEYEALSYTWGNTSPTHTLTVVSRDEWPGGTISITTNLDTALRSLRLPKQPRVLWIDALCINQANVQERNHQVQWMDQVYKKARRVVVYIGAADDADEEAVDMLTSIGRCVDIEGSTFTPRVYIQNPPPPPPPLLKPTAISGDDDGNKRLRTLKGSVRAVTALLRLSHNQAFIKLSDQHTPPACIVHDGTMVTALQMSRPSVLAIVKLLQRPWFTRLWVIQEARSMRNSKDGILLYGTRAVSWEDFRRGIVAFKHVEQADDESAMVTISTQTWLTHLTYVICHREMRVSVIQLSSLHHFHCADPRDRLYGILSLIRDELGYPLAVDYTLSTTTIFTDFHRQEFKKRGLWHLTLCHLDLESKWDAPSWVPNQHSFPTHSQEIKNAPAFRFAPIFDLVNDRCLKVYGCRAATVRTVVQCPPIVESWSPTEGPAFMLGWLYHVASALCEGAQGQDQQEQLANKIMGLCDIRGDYDETHIPQDSRYSLRRSTMKALVFEMFSPAVLDTLSYNNRVGNKKPTLPHPVELLLYALYSNLHRAMGYSSSPVVFSTTDDEAGYGPKSTLPGDQLCTILGSRTDLLLRSVTGQEEDNKENKHVIVGPASIASNVRSEVLLGPVPRHVYLAQRHEDSNVTFQDTRTGAMIHDRRLDRPEWKETTEGWKDTCLRGGDIRCTLEELQLLDIHVEPFYLV